MTLVAKCSTSYGEVGRKASPLRLSRRLGLQRHRAVLVEAVRLPSRVLEHGFRGVGGVPSFDGARIPVDVRVAELRQPFRCAFQLPSAAGGRT